MYKLTISLLLSLIGLSTFGQKNENIVGCTFERDTPKCPYYLTFTTDSTFSFSGPEACNGRPVAGYLLVKGFWKRNNNELILNSFIQPKNLENTVESFSIDTVRGIKFLITDVFGDTVISHSSRGFSTELKGSGLKNISTSADGYERYVKIDKGTFIIYQYGNPFYKLNLQTGKNVYIIRTTLNRDGYKFFTNEKWFIEVDKLNNPNTKKTKHNTGIVNTYSKESCRNF